MASISSISSIVWRSWADTWGSIQASSPVEASTDSARRSRRAINVSRRTPCLETSPTLDISPSPRVRHRFRCLGTSLAVPLIAKRAFGQKLGVRITGSDMTGLPADQPQRVQAADLGHRQAAPPTASEGVRPGSVADSLGTDLMAASVVQRLAHRLVEQALQRCDRNEPHFEDQPPRLTACHRPSRASCWQVAFSLSKPPGDQYRRSVAGRLRQAQGRTIDKISPGGADTYTQ